MCEPTTILAVSALATSIVGTGLQAYGQVQQGKFAAEQGIAEQQLMTYKARIAQQRADDAIQRGQFAQVIEGIRTKQRLGKAKVAGAGLGQEVGTGSMLDIIGDIGRFGRLDQLTIMSNAQREALGFEQDIPFLIAKGKIARAKGQAAKSLGYLSAAGTLITGAGKVAQKWYGFERERAFG